MKTDQESGKEINIHEKRPVYVKRDLYIWKVSSIFEKYPVYMKRDQESAKGTNTYEKSPIYIWDLYVWRETYIYATRPTNTKSILIHEKRPRVRNRDLYIWKETSL